MVLFDKEGSVGSKGFSILQRMIHLFDICIEFNLIKKVGT